MYHPRIFLCSRDAHKSTQHLWIDMLEQYSQPIFKFQFLFFSKPFTFFSFFVISRNFTFLQYLFLFEPRRSFIYNLFQRSIFDIDKNLTLTHDEEPTRRIKGL